MDLVTIASSMSRLWAGGSIMFWKSMDIEVNKIIPEMGF